MNKFLFIILLLLSFSISAQQLPRDRFGGDLLSGCNNCNLAQDGIVHLQFDPDTAEIVTENINGTSTERFKVTVRVKAASSSAPFAYVSGNARIRYNNSAFGALVRDRLCDFDRSSIFTAFSSDFSRRYSLGRTQNDPDRITLTETTALSSAGDPFDDSVLQSIDISNYAELTNDYQPLITMRCTINNEEMDAGFVFDGQAAGEQNIRNFVAEASTTGLLPSTPMLALADNDFRGFRLDGKTWVKDYARYGDGKGVRLEFSKNIMTPLAVGHFSLDNTDDSRISTVTHMVGTPYAEIEFSGEAIANDILRISTGTTVMDVDRLANDNFAASLFYDEGAPRIDTRPTQDGNAFTLTFSSPISPIHLSPSDLCVTEPNGICQANESSRTVPVLSVTTHGEMPTTLTMVVDPAAGAKTGGMRSIEFRRNAVLLANNTPGQGDLKVVEDYQPRLREALELQDMIGAQITVARTDIRGDSISSDLVPIGGRYVIYFRVTADEDVGDLDQLSSYQLQDNGRNPISFDPASAITPVTSQSRQRDVIITYFVPVSNQRVSGAEFFRLVRSGATSLRDGANRDPIRDNDNPSTTRIANGAEITPNASARAPRDTTGPSITVTATRAIPNPDNGNRYTMSFTVTNSEHGDPMNNPISDLADLDSYTLLRRSGGSNSSSGFTIVPYDPNDNDSSTSSIDISGGEATATLEFVVTMPTQTITEATEGFLLARADNDNALLDSNRNAPRFGGNNIVRGTVIDASAIAERDTTRPNLTVMASEPELTTTMTYNFSFKVTASEPVRGLDNASSYSLLVAEEEDDITDGGLVAATNPTPIVSFSADRPTTATVSYMNVHVINDLPNTTFPYGLMLGRANDGLLDLANNDPLQTNADGTRPANTPGNEVSNDEPLQAADPDAGERGAVVLLDSTPPRITVTANSIVADPATSGRYTIQFTISADEAVRNIGTAASYILKRIQGTNNFSQNVSDIATVTPVVADGTSLDGNRAVINYTVTFTGNIETRLTNIRGTQGFTLALVSGTGQINLQDIATNLPVKRDGSPIYNNAGTGFIETNGIIAPITGGIIDARAVAARDTTGPDLTVMAVAGGASPGATPTTFTGSFNVTATENIRDIHTTRSYVLLRIPLSSGGTANNAGAVVETDASLIPISGTNLSQAATIGFTATLDNVEQARSTFGFTLARGPITSGGLRDVWDNAVTANSAQADRLTAGNSAVATIEKVPPQINVVAFGSEPKAVPVAGSNGRQYTVTFDVNVENNEEVRGIGNTSSYNVIRMEGSSEITFTAIRGTPNAGNTRARLVYTVTVDGSPIGITGFNLAGTNNAEALRDNSGNFAVPVGSTTPIANNMRIDGGNDAIATRDNTPPIISIVDNSPMALAKPFDDDDDTFGGDSIRNYEVAFMVNVEEDGGDVATLGLPTSYQLYRITTPTMMPTTDGFDATIGGGPNLMRMDAAVSILYDVKFVNDEDVRNTHSFGLYRANDVNALIDDSGNLPIRNRGRLPNDPSDDDRIDPNTEIDSTLRASRERANAMECAAFYPNIGQTELFFNVVSEYEVDNPPEENLEITQQGSTSTISLAISSLEQDGIILNDGRSILKATLDEEIRSRIEMDAIDATYTHTTSTSQLNVASIRADCSRDLTEDADSDGDGLIDVADNSPFDGSASTETTSFNDLDGNAANPNTAAPLDDRADPPVEVLDDAYYSREAVVRSLLRGEEFTYIHTDGSRQTFTEMDALDREQYFGIEENANTQIFRIESDSECDLVLDAARMNNLIKVRINEFCGNDRVTAFSAEPVTSGQEYKWAEVGSDGLLVPSEVSGENDYFSYTLRILPEINFLGQSSYIFPTTGTQTVLISAYTGDDSRTIDSLEINNNRGSSDIEEELVYDSQTKTISNDDDPYNIATNALPIPGETITHWLVGGSRIWRPTTRTVARLGVEGETDPLANIDYAIGPNNNVDVRVAGDDETVTRIRQILLYDIDNNMRVSSVVANRRYYVIADYDTNAEMADDVGMINAALIANYRDFPTTPAEVEMEINTIVESLRMSNNLKGEYETVLGITANDNITTDTMSRINTISVGWNNIVDIMGVQATYKISPNQPLTYEVVDGTASIRGSQLGTTTALPVDILNNADQTNDVLRAHDGQDDLPVFFTHTGLIIAANRGGNMRNDYSAANIDYTDEDRDIERLTGLTGGINAGIISIATFGVSDVPYGFSSNADGITTTTNVIGGTAYITFPIQVDDDLVGDSLYVGKYTDSWRPFERGLETGDTWFAIQRRDRTQSRDRMLIGSSTAPCPTSPEVYMNEHTGTRNERGTDNMDFIASKNNCIMLVITDGNLYDVSSQDGRIIDPVGISTIQLSDGTEQPRRGGGGGAVGISDAILLIGGIALLLVATARNRRRKQTTATS